MNEEDRIIIDLDETEFGAEKEAKKTVRVLSFKLGNEHYCIDIIQAKEVFKPTSITKVPNAPAFIAGVTNLHGEIIPLIDIRYFLGLGSKEGLGAAKIIVTDVNGSAIGIMVDDIDEAMEIEEAAIQPPLTALKGSLAAYIAGQMQIGKDILILLDLEKVLKCEEIEKLKMGG